MKKQVITEIICGLLVLLFVYTALSKLLNFELFTRTLAQSPLIGNVYKIVGWSIIIAELIIALAVFLQKYRLIGLVSALCLLSFFTIYLGYLLLFERDHLPCSCGGVLEQMTWRQHLLFNIFFIVITLYAVYTEQLRTSKKQKFLLH